MPRKTLMTFGLLCIGLCLTTSALGAPRSQVLTQIGSSGEMFVGTPGELIAAAMPEMLARIGVQVDPAEASFVEALEATFPDNGDFAWQSTFMRVDDRGNGFSFTLPARADLIRQKVLVMGVVEGSSLARAFVVQATESEGSVQFSFTRPDGADAGTVVLGVADGRLLSSANDLLVLAKLFYPAAAKGTFDGIIDALQGVLNALYQVLNMINMAICAVNEAIEAMYEMNACPLYDIDLGTGDLAYALVCLVQGVIGFVNEVQGCF